MKRLIEKIIGAFVPGGGPSGNTEEGRFTSKTILKELKSHFSEELDRLSVGDRMIYPMSFNILMHPDDYAQIKESLVLACPVFVAAFYDIIRDRRARFPVYTPPATFWFLQFTACRPGALAEAGDLVVERGHLTTMASLFTFDLKEASCLSEEENLQVSVRKPNSNVNFNYNVNNSILKGMDIVGENTFKIVFDPKLDSSVQRIAGTTEGEPHREIATLTYSSDGSKFLRYKMMDSLIQVSGRNDKREGRAIFKIDSDAVENSHLQIRYLREWRAFEIAAFAPVMLNGRKLTLSSGGNLLWHKLADKSSIFIGDSVNLEFEIRN